MPLQEQCDLNGTLQPVSEVGFRYNPSPSFSFSFVLGNVTVDVDSYARFGFLGSLVGIMPSNLTGRDPP